MSDNLYDLLGWADPALAYQGQEDYLAASAYAAAEKAADLILAQHERGRVLPDDPLMVGFGTGMARLDKAWRGYVVQGGERPPADVVHEALTFWGGELVAAFVERVLEAMRLDEDRPFDPLRAALDGLDGLPVPCSTVGLPESDPEFHAALARLRGVIEDMLGRGVSRELIQAALDSWTAATNGPRVNIIEME